jgi:hypothetical protein
MAMTQQWPVTSVSVLQPSQRPSNSEEDQISDLPSITAVMIKLPCVSDQGGTIG